jgi:hypothetical protein
MAGAAVLWAGVGTLFAVALNQEIVNAVTERRPVGAWVTDGAAT